MAIEDFTTYTEVDSASRVAVGTRRVAWTLLDGDEQGQVYKDKGANFFDGDFVHDLTLELTTTSSGVFTAIWELANATADFGANNPSLYLYHNKQFGTDVRLTLVKIDTGGSATDFNTNLSLDTIYYLKIVRDESVGSFGTIYCYIYTDDARTVLLDTLSVTLGEKVDFQYIFVLNNDEGGGGRGSYKWLYGEP